MVTQLLCICDFVNFILLQQVTDKEKIRQLEKDLAICRKTVEKLQKEITVLMQEIMVINPEWREYIENDV